MRDILKHIIDSTTKAYASFFNSQKYFFLPIFSVKCSASNNIKEANKQSTPGIASAPNNIVSNSISKLKKIQSSFINFFKVEVLKIELLAYLGCFE